MTLIGRITKDTKLNYEPEDIKTKGRKMVYGKDAPRPDQIRAREKIPYQTVKGWTAGKVHDFKVKIIKDLKWRSTGKKIPKRWQ
jgi:hypothetical protein